MNNDKINTRFARIKPYILVFSLYMAVLLILLIVFDNLVMPAVINSGSKVKVPYLIGKKLELAQKELEKNDLDWKVIKETYSDKFPVGTIIAQIPSPNLTIKSNRPILLTVSKGQEKVPVPYLIGSNVRSARLALMQRGLELGDISYEFNESFPKETICRQLISAGSLVPYGSKIDLVISKGPENQNVVPSLIGYSFDEVKSVISESGFVLGNVQYKVSETYLPNTVIDQFPKAGEMVAPGTPINVTISK